MNHGSLATWDNVKPQWDRVDEDHPMPVAALGEAVDAASAASANAYVLITDSVVDTQKSGHGDIAFQCVIDTADVTLKAVCSLDGTNWYDVTGSYDETATQRSGGAAVEVTTSLGIDVTVAVVFLIPVALPQSCFRYFGIQHKSATTDTPGNNLVNVFTK